MNAIRTFTTSDINNLLSRSAIGAESLIKDFFDVGGTQSKYPPYDIIAKDDDNYRLEVAVAGFKRDELTIEIKNETLVISGTKVRLPEVELDDVTSPPEVHYIHKGIAKRDFTISFKLFQYIVVDSADLADGILTINLKRELPEALKPRIIDIR